MAPRCKDGRLQLKEPLATDLAAFRAAIGMGTTEIGVIRDAVRAFIDERLKDAGFREKFETERAKLATAKVQQLRLVRGDKEPSA